MKEFLTPPPPRDLPRARLELRKEALMRTIAMERKRPTYRRRRRRMAAILLPAALLGVAAAGYVISKPDEIVAGGIGCYDRPSLDANISIVSTTGEDPVAVCTELWSTSTGAGGAAPAMTACAGQGSAVHVFPSNEEGICLKLGLEDLPDGYVAAAKRFAKMRDDVIKELYVAATAGPATERNACLDEETALRVVNNVLAEHGFTDWTAEPATGDYEGRECANDVGFDDVAKKVLVIPSFRGEGISAP